MAPRLFCAGNLAQLPIPGPHASLLDEPTTGLDLKHETMILEIARAFASEGGGVLAVLHDLNLAATYADRIGVLRGGNIFSIGRPAEVITDGILRDAFGVDLEVSGTPKGETPFILPQMIRPRPGVESAA